MNNLKPISYLWIYLFIVFLFALIYSFIPNQFHYSTLKEERTKIKIESNLIDSLEKQISFEFQNIESMKTSEWKISKVFLKENNHSEKEITLDAFVSGFNNRLAQRFNISFSIDISTNAAINNPLTRQDEFGNVEFKTLDEVKWVREVSITNVDSALGNMRSLPFEFSELFSCKFYPSFQSCIEMPEATNDILNQYILYLEGEPQSWVSNFFRMLYFSVISITTVGYGDVTPLTNMSRLLITLQVLLGPILLGMFLSSLNRKD